MVKQTHITFFVCFFGRIERLLRMCVLRMFNGMVMDQHSQDNQAEYTEDTQHNNHVPCSFSTASIKNNIIKNRKTAQNKNFCSNVSFAKNSPAKYPPRIILAKSPIKPAMKSLDFEVNHCINPVGKTLTYIKYAVNRLASNMIGEIPFCRPPAGEAGQAGRLAC